MASVQWVKACETSDIDREDVIRFDCGDATYAVYRTEDDAYYATDGHCTHGRFHLADGLVTGRTIECPKHNGRFDIPTGQAKRAPACVNLRTHPVRVDGGSVYIGVEGGEGAGDIP